MIKTWAMALALMTGSGLTTAEASVFYVNPALSTITLSGSSTLTDAGGSWSATFLGVSTSGGFDLTGGGSLVQQGAGSLTTSLVGTIEASETGGILTFNGASISANNNGAWRPDGSNSPGNTALAQLAGQVTPNVDINFTDNILSFVANFVTSLLEPQLGETSYFAARSVGLNVTGNSALGGGGLFDINSLTEAFTSGVFNVGGQISDAWPLAGLSGSTGSGTGTFSDGIVDELILPFDFTLTHQFSLPRSHDSIEQCTLFVCNTASYGVTRGSVDVTTRYVGQIVANTQTANGSVPEPATLALLAFGLAALAGITWSRHRRT